MMIHGTKIEKTLLPKKNRYTVRTPTLNEMGV